uniref:Uncharacterized protein n=1 Tax=Human cytomegalovirus TaxID=10359 RepID=Q69211_HCMV|nr:unknown protein [Human betaherpesvirus 5]
MQRHGLVVEAVSGDRVPRRRPRLNPGLKTELHSMRSTLESIYKDMRQCVSWFLCGGAVPRGNNVFIARCFTFVGLPASVRLRR